jgi:PAS domain S-box-containing protein
MIIFYLFTSAREYSEAIFWRKIFSFWPFAVIVQTYFVIIFTERKNILKNRVIYPFFYIPPLIITIWEVNGLIVDDLIMKSWGWVEINSLSPFFILTSIYASVIGFFNLFLCLHYIFTIKNIEKQHQAIYIFLGMSIPIIFGIGSQIFFQILDLNFPDITVFGWGLGCIAIAIGILKSNLFTLTPSSAAESILTSMVSSNDFSDLVERSFDLIYAVDMEGVVKYISPSVENILGYSRNEIRGQAFHSYIEPSMLPIAIESFSNVISSTNTESQVEALELKLRKKNGQYAILLANSMPIVKNGEIYGLQGVAKDVSDYELLEKSRESFIAMISHELRTPLAIIKGYSEFLDQNYEDLDPKKIGLSFEAITQNVHRLEQLIQDVVDIDKIARVSLKINPKEVDVSELLNSSIAPFTILLGSQIRIDNQMKNIPLIIKCDPLRFQQVIDNIIQNAMKHTSKTDRQIIVDLSSDEDNVKIKVSDNGAGISPENLERIFDQFVSIPTKFSATGTGIGLYISSKIINAHKGQLIAESEGEGLGSSFIIKLPRN